MAFYIEVNCARDWETKADWQRVKPTNGKPYQFLTREIAENYSGMCHDGLPWTVRIVEDKS